MICFAAAALSGCVESDVDRRGTSKEYIRLEPNFILASDKAYLTRADDDIFTRIDDVHLMIFDGTNPVTLSDGTVVPNDGASVEERNYYEYGVRQNVYLRKGSEYFIFALANLDDRYCPTGDIESFLAQVKTYADLKELYVQAINYSADDIGKMMMSTMDVVRVTMPAAGEVFSPKVPLYRLRSQFVVTVYNKVASASDATITSGVWPSSLSFVDVPRYSYVMTRPVVTNGSGAHDKAYPLGAEGYYESTTNLMPESSGIERITVRSAKTGELQTNYYTKQQVTFYCLENRRGSIDRQAFTDYQATDPSTGNPVAVPDVYARRALAPSLSTYVRLTSLTDEDVLRTYVYAGKGRDVEANPDFTNPSTGQDDITNYDVDRSCIYHFNIYINGIEDVTVDSRRDYLDQLILINRSDDFDRLDAHYMDVPIRIEGRANGYVKLEAGVGEGAAWRPMSNLPPEEQWLTFSWQDPYPGDANVTTAIYAALTTANGVADITPILHLDEYVNTVDATTYPAGARRASIPASNPPRRTAVVRVGFVDGATSEAEYEQGTASVFFFEVSQYGLQTIGQVSGWTEGSAGVGGHYQTQLGVESVEEYWLRFYLQGENQDVVRAGVPWRYIAGPGAGLAENRYPYDGLAATIYRYGEYRDSYPGTMPPVRNEQALNPEGTLAGNPAIYNPYSNTNAPDYCVRKNRDSDGNGMIDGNEIKWYMPTPAQTMQMFAWREAFRGGSWSLNRGYTPFSTTAGGRYYWTTTEQVTGADPNAYVVDFGQTQPVAMVTAMNKNTRYPVRCVRDIEGALDHGLFYNDGQGHVVGNMTGYFPPQMIADGKAGIPTNELRNPVNNTLGRAFAVSRWYGTSSSHPATPSTASGDEKACGNYSEPGLTSGWVLPSQQELSLIYAYAGMIENLFAAEYATPGASTYHRFTPGEHWAITNVGNNSTFWRVNFTSGAAATVAKQNLAYYRCIRYFDTNNIPPRQATP